MLLLGMAIERVEAATIQNNSGVSDPELTITFDEIVLPPGTPLSDQYSELGVVFSPDLFYNPDPNVLNPPDPSIPSNNAIGNFVIEGLPPGVVAPPPGIVAPPPGLPPTVNPFSVAFTQAQDEAAFGAATAFPGVIELTALLDGVEQESFSAQTAGSLDPLSGQLGAPNFVFYGFSDLTFDEIQVAIQSPPSPAGEEFAGVQIDNIQLGASAAPEAPSQSVPESSSVFTLLAMGVFAVGSYASTRKFESGS